MNFWRRVGNLFKRAGRAIVSGINYVANHVRDAFETAGDAVIGGINDVANRVNNVFTRPKNTPAAKRAVHDVQYVQQPAAVQFAPQVAPQFVSAPGHEVYSQGNLLVTMNGSPVALKAGRTYKQEGGMLIEQPRSFLRRAWNGIKEFFGAEPSAKIITADGVENKVYHGDEIRQHLEVFMPAQVQDIPVGEPIVGEPMAQGIPVGEPMVAEPVEYTDVLQQQVAVDDSVSVVSPTYPIVETEANTETATTVVTNNIPNGLVVADYAKVNDAANVNVTANEQQANIVMTQVQESPKPVPTSAAANCADDEYLALTAQAEELAGSKEGGFAVLTATLLFVGSEPLFAYTTELNMLTLMMVMTESLQPRGTLNLLSQSPYSLFATTSSAGVEFIHDEANYPELFVA